MTALAFIAVFTSGLGVGACLVILIAIKIEENRDARIHAQALANLRDAGITFTEIPVPER